ncbi:putative Transitional endoplasmic reticulum ATPase [Trypanosoma grayi]|uniref:putative Transitional endoplasmic reticulum ATPase n=1 Tax=Trypanosoma grayi TaxID=71804 RepID=UPI0004F4AF5D|nr:putative Transitional endoplasmic reticulum ATPase [Trypanosoma grayi]KEG15122.1 putative Transitional endoplasmic reticulum ATPase [Trypanosoma grayi]
MLRVPALWACASSSVALVQVNEGAVAICCVVALPCDAVSWEFECAITISAKSAAVLTAQDFSRVETRKVFFLSGPSSRKQRFIEAPFGTTGASDTLSIWTPHHTYVAKTVLLEGLRVSFRGSQDRLFASMVGRYVVVGCEVETDDGIYHVKSVELQSGYRGLALVCATTRVKLNHRPALSSQKPAVLVGLKDQACEVGAILRAMEKRPGSWIGVAVDAPRGCGAMTLIKQCAAEIHAVLVRWSPTTIWDRLEELWGARLVVLCIPSMNVIFPPSEDALAKLTARVLLRDIDRLVGERNGTRAAVVLVGITDSGVSDAVSALFSVKVTVELPDVYTRAALLAQVRGGEKENYMNEAHTLVGHTSAAVLEFARGPSRVHKPPIKPLLWSEIGGLDDVKERLRRALILPRLQPEAFARFGVVPPRGILLYGPPGCAKTSLVKALCSEGCFSFIYLDSATLISAYVGESERQLRDVFRKAARQTPCIVFFDEVEVLGGKRGAGSHDGDQARLLSTLLTEMDGFIGSSGVCFVGATNTPHLLDSALLRPGRFDYLVYIPLPPRDDRREILALTLAGTAADVDALADATEGFSGADLTSLTSGVLLELLEGSEEGIAPSCLNDAVALTDILQARIRTFHKTAYDVAALEEFHKDCSSFGSSM